MSISTVPFALAVDDDPIILMDISGILEDAGFRTHEADHGDDAIAMLPDHAESITRKTVPIGFGVMSADEVMERIFMLTNAKVGSDF